MNIWDKLLEVDIENKERFQALFYEIVNRIPKNTFPLTLGEREEKDHFIIIEENRMNSYFIHIVPKQVYTLFKEMQASAPGQFLGFSVVAGKYNNRDVRVSCFGVPCQHLAKSLVTKGKKL